MINEDMKMKYSKFESKISKLEKQVLLYKEVYHDIDLSALHEKNRKLVSFIEF